MLPLSGIERKQLARLRFPMSNISLALHDLLHRIAMTSTSRDDAYYRNLYTKDPDFRQLAAQDADFRNM